MRPCQTAEALCTLSLAHGPGAAARLSILLRRYHTVSFDILGPFSTLQNTMRIRPKPDDDSMERAVPFEDSAPMLNNPWPQVEDASPPAYVLRQYLSLSLSLIL